MRLEVSAILLVTWTNLVSRTESKARFIALTEGGKWWGELLVEVPVTGILPTIGYRSVGRAFKERVYSPYLKEYNSDYEFGPLLSRIDAYFYYLNIMEERCRKRFLCEIAREPDKYSPVSELMGKTFRIMRKFPRPKVHRKEVFRLYSYYWAHQLGQKQPCNYPSCDMQADEIINMTVLRLWQKLSRLFSIKLTDE